MGFFDKAKKAAEELAAKAGEVAGQVAEKADEVANEVKDKAAEVIAANSDRIDAFQTKAHEVAQKAAAERAGTADEPPAAPPADPASH